MEQPRHEREIIVVGGGISGLAAAFRVSERTGERVTVLEREGRVGGTASTDSVGGFTIDRGPNGFLTSTPDMWMLAHDVGIGREVKPAAPAASERSIYSDGRMHLLGKNPMSLFTGDLLSARGRARALAEPFIRSEQPEEESVWDFVSRRFGQEFADVIANTAILGITGGDSRRLSMRALFPRVADWEREHGSVVRAIFAKQLSAARGKLRPRLGDSNQSHAPSSGLHSFGADGIQRISEAIAQKGRVEVRTNAGVIAVRKSVSGDHRYVVQTQSGDVYLANQVVLAVPAYVAGRLVEGMSRDLSRRLSQIRYSDIVVATMGYENRALHNTPAGFGFLVRRGEGIRLLGCQFTSSIYPEQAPANHTLLRCMFGGGFDSEIAQMERGNLQRLIESELYRTLGIEATPVLRHVVRWIGAIPQYELGHRERVRKIEEACGQHRGLHVAGNAYYGVALNACAADAHRVASEVMMERRGTRIGAPRVAL